MTAPGARRTFRNSTGAREVDIPFGVRAGAAWTWRLLVIALGVLAALWLIAFFQLVVVPVLVALLVTALLAPGVDSMQARGVPRGAAVAVSVVLLVLAVAGLLALVGTMFAGGFRDLADQSAEGFAQVREWLVSGPLDLSYDQLDRWLEQGGEQVAANRDQVVAGALSFTSTAGHVVTGLFLALFTTVFFLLDGRAIWVWAIGLLPRPARQPLDQAAGSGWVTLTSYVRATIVVALVDAVGIGAGAAALQVPLAVPLAVLVFLGAFVPIVGALVSGGVAVLVALVAHGPVIALLMLAVVIGVQQVESHLLQPLLLGRAVHVHPLAVVLAIGAGIIVAGIVGALFAVPLVAVLNTVGRHLAGRDDDPPEARADGPLAPT